MRTDKQYAVTRSRGWIDATDGIVVDVEEHDSIDGYAVRLVVNNEPSPWESHYQGVLVWRGYGYAGHYWGDPNYEDNDQIPVDQPFRITRLTKV